VNDVEDVTRGTMERGVADVGVHDVPVLPLPMALSFTTTAGVLCRNWSLTLRSRVTFAVGDFTTSGEG